METEQHVRIEITVLAATMAPITITRRESNLPGTGLLGSTAWRLVPGRLVGGSLVPDFDV